MPSRLPPLPEAVYMGFGADDRGRTGTGISSHGILSPGRLPVPPLRHSSKCFRILNDPEETRTLDLRRDRAAL